MLLSAMDSLKSYSNMYMEQSEVKQMTCLPSVRSEPCERQRAFVNFWGSLGWKMLLLLFYLPLFLYLWSFSTHNLLILIDWVSIVFNLCPLCIPLLACLPSFLPLPLVPPLPDSLRIATWLCYSRYFLSPFLVPLCWFRCKLCLMFPKLSDL